METTWSFNCNVLGSIRLNNLLLPGRGPAG
jgi:hypothetical protein